VQQINDETVRELKRQLAEEKRQIEEQLEEKNHE